MSKVIETDTKTFIRFWLVPLCIALLIVFLYHARTGLVVVGISIFLAIALKPLVHRVNTFFSRRFGGGDKHRTASAALAYLIVVLAIGGIIAVVGPVVVNETTKFVQNFPDTFEKVFGGWEGVNNFGRTFGIEDLHAKISDAVAGISSALLGLFGNNIISSLGGLANIFAKIFLVLILTLLFLLEGPEIMDMLWGSLGSGEDKSTVAVAKRVIDRMANVISTYVSRQVIVAVIDGLAACVIVFLVSLFTDVPTGLAIPMGMITMLFYLIPMFGQFIGGSLVTAILFFSSPVAAVVFAAIYIIYAQIENNVIAPKIQGGALNLPAVLILSAIVIGMYMGGLLGAIVAVPIAGCLRVLIDEYPNIIAARK